MRTQGTELHPRKVSPSINLTSKYQFKDIFFSYSTVSKRSNRFFHETFNAKKSILQSDDALANQYLQLVGRFRFHKNEWEKLTSENAILDVVMGYKIDFIVPLDDLHKLKRKLFRRY